MTKQSGPTRVSEICWKALRSVMRHLAVVLVIAAASSAFAADKPIFRWVDKKGVVHITDRLMDVPEPYRSMYAAELERRRKEEAAKPQATSVPEQSEVEPPLRRAPAKKHSIVEREIARRKMWQDRVQKWRQELAAATRQVERVDRALAQARLNPLLRYTPRVKEEIEQLEKERQAALARLERARDMLLVKLPQRAREERVPPKWLE